MAAAPFAGLKGLLTADRTDLMARLLISAFGEAIDGRAGARTEVVQ